MQNNTNDAQASLSQAPPREDKHQLDPVNRTCLACGATSEQIDDRIYRVCPADGVALGPNRIAIIAARGELFRRQSEIDAATSAVERATRDMGVAHDRINYLGTLIAAKRAELAELETSIERLQAPADFDTAAFARLRKTSGGYGT